VLTAAILPAPCSGRRDRALAFEVYARQAKIDRQREKAKGSPGNQHTGPLPSGNGSKLPPTLRELGVSAKQAHTWRKLADVPQEQFEDALADPDRKSTIAGIIAAATPPEPEVVPVLKGALWLWGDGTDNG